MGWYLLRRLVISIITLFLATIVVFAGVRALPGGPAVALSAETSNPAVLAQIRHEYGLDKPLPVQYVRWIEQVFQGNLGTSPKTGLSVSKTLLQRLPVTAELTLLAMFIALLIGLPIGILAAVRRNSIADYICTSAALIGLSVPHFWLGLLFILAFAVHLGLLPASGFVSLAHPLANFEHIIMPAFVLSMGLAAIIMRQMRSAMLESLGADYVRTARAKGMSESRTVLVHALRNSLTTVVTIVGLQVGTLMSGAIITEQIFLIPGLGRLAVQSVFSRDYPDLQGIVLIAATSYILANLLTDLAYSLLNPRVRVAESAS
jgi:peptide/nickel transport system permease protein